MPAVFLVGMPGSGKTTVGRLLAARLGARFVDLDDVVEREAGRTIDEIYAAGGEAAFRDLEEGAMADVAASVGAEDAVVATGGGVVLREANRRVLSGGSEVVFLDAPPEVLLPRIRGTAGRPLLRSGTPFDRIAADRRPLYEEVATIRLDATRPPDDLVDELARSLSFAR